MVEKKKNEKSSPMEKRKAYAKQQDEISKTLKEKKAVFISARTGKQFSEIATENIFKPIKTPLEILLGFNLLQASPEVRKRFDKLYPNSPALALFRDKEGNINADQPSTAAYDFVQAVNPDIAETPAETPAETAAETAPVKPASRFDYDIENQTWLSDDYTFIVDEKQPKGKEELYVLSQVGDGAQKISFDITKGVLILIIYTPEEIKEAQLYNEIKPEDYAAYRQMVNILLKNKPLSEIDKASPKYKVVYEGQIFADTASGIKPAPAQTPQTPAQTPQTPARQTPQTPAQQPPQTPARQPPQTPAQTIGMLTPPDSSKGSKEIPQNIVAPINLAVENMETFIKNTKKIEAQTKQMVGLSESTAAEKMLQSAMITNTDNLLNLIRLDLRIALRELDKKYNATEKTIEQMSEHIKENNLLSSNSTLEKKFNKSFSEQNLGLINAYEETYKFTAFLLGQGINHKAIVDSSSSKSKKSSFLKGIVNTNGDFGNLNIDMNLLFLKHILKAKQKNKVVLQRNIDQSFIDLLTKRYYRTKKYSDLAKQVYSELVSLAGVNIDSSFTKSELIQGQGQGIKIMRSADELVDRLEIIVGSRKAGNNSKEIINDGMEIIDALLKEKAIDRVEHRTLYNKYFKM